MTENNSFGAKGTLDAGGREYEIFRLDALQPRFDVARLPFSLKVLLENTGVGAYNGAAPSIKSKQVLASAGSIVQIEARHAAAIDLLIGKSPTPNQGFDKPLTEKQVLAAAGPLIKS